MTPPGSACSITIGKGITDAADGSVRSTHPVVTDIHDMGSSGWEPGPHPERADYGSFADFKDPDGNTWVLQERENEPAR